MLLVALNLHASGPAMTTISDVVYRANGQTATGTAVITWPGFTTGDGKAVAAGELSLAIGPSGVLTLALAPNEGSTPSGTYYKVVYKLSDGTTSTEYWVVPSASPTTIAAIRAKVVPTQVAAQLASKQYVDTVVAGNTDAVVHKTGTESITGVKAFSVSPTAPNPTTATAIANKAYVDAAVGNVTGGYVRTSGDSMTGQLTLAGDPAAPNQAANRHYVDLQASTLTGGLNSKLGRINDSPITLAGVRYADQFASGSNTGGIAEAYADCSSTGCTVQLGADINIASAQTFATIAGKPLVLKGAGRKISCSNTSGACLKIIKNDGATRDYMGVENLVFAYAGASSGVTGLQIGDATHPATNVSLHLVSFNNFSTTNSVGLDLNFVEDSHFDSISYNGNNLGLQLDLATNQNQFSNNWFQANATAISLTDASENTFLDCLVQSNTAAKVVQLIASAGNIVGNKFKHCHFENNGDGTTNGRQIYLQAASGKIILRTAFEDNVFNGGANVNASSYVYEFAGAGIVEFSSVKRNQYFTSANIITGTALLPGLGLTAENDALNKFNVGLDVNNSTGCDNGGTGLVFSPPTAGKTFQIYGGYPGSFDSTLLFKNCTDNQYLLKYVGGSGTWDFQDRLIKTSNQFQSTLATGTAPFVVASTTNVPNLNASLLNGNTFANPGAIGGGTPSTGAFTTVNATTAFQVNGAALNLTNLAGSVSATQMPALSGDATSTAGTATTTVGKVNGVSFGASPATDTIPVITAANTATYKSVAACVDAGGNHLNYDISSHAFSCGTSTSGTGFNAISTGANTTATMTVGTGAVVTTTGSGVNNANQFKGNSTVAVADGGTGQTTYTKGDLLTSAGGSSLIRLAAGSYSQHLVADPAAPNGIRWSGNETKPNVKISRSFFACGAATACASNDSTNTSVGLTGTGAVPGTGYPVALTLTATTTVNNVANMDGRSLYRTGRNHLFQADTYFPATTDYAATRAFIGLTDQTAATMVGSDAPIGNYAGFLFSTTAGTTNWYCIQGNGTATAVSSGVAGNSTTNHKFEFAFDDTAANMVYRIDGNVVCTNPTTATLPSANINMKMEIAIQNLTAGTTRAIGFSWLFDIGDL